MFIGKSSLMMLFSIAMWVYQRVNGDVDQQMLPMAAICFVVSKIGHVEWELGEQVFTTETEGKNGSYFFQVVLVWKHFCPAEVWQANWILSDVHFPQGQQTITPLFFFPMSRSTLDGYFNPLVFWYHWDYLRLPAKIFYFFFAGCLRLALIL